jgi:histidine ammonia-lyase
MGATSARHARDVLRNVEIVLGLELLCASQGLDFRVASIGQPGAGVARAHALVRERIAHLATDRDPGPDIAAAADLVRSGRLLTVLDD